MGSAEWTLSGEVKRRIDSAIARLDGAVKEPADAPTANDFTVGERRGIKVIAELEDTRKRSWAVHGMVQVLKHSDGSEPFGELEIESFAESFEIVLAPTYEAVDHGIEALQGGAA